MMNARKSNRAKFSADQIVDAGFKILRERGQDSVVIRAVANELGSSTMVIYSHIKSKERLLMELLQKAYDVLNAYMNQERTGDLWIDWGVGYIIFSIEEPELFKLILREHAPTHKTGPQYKLWSSMLESVKEYTPFRGLSDEQVEMLVLRRYMFSVGLATHMSKAPEGLLSEAQIIDMIRGTSLALLEGARSGTMTAV